MKQNFPVLPHLSRRAAITGAAALAAFPLRAREETWASIADRARALDQLHAIMIRQNGSDVLAEAFRGPAIGRAVPVKSVSKTLVAALTGAAIDRGEIPSVTSTIAELAPRLVPRSADPRAGALTVENLVTMQAGLERTSGAGYAGWISSSDWVANALQRPFVAEPGSRMLYSTGSFHILGAVLSTVADESLLGLARIRLGAPLGISIPAWTRDPQGRYLGGNEMALSLPDMIRFGELYRRGGDWNGRQVLSSAWVDRSFEQRTRSPWSGLGYGYGWFLGRAGGDRFSLARGYGGQIICIVPDLALTIAITSDPTRPARSGGYFSDLMQLISDKILPVARLYA